MSSHVTRQRHSLCQPRTRPPHLAPGKAEAGGKQGEAPAELASGGFTVPLHHVRDQTCREPIPGPWQPSLHTRCQRQP